MSKYVGNTFHVDGSRTDDYTASGSEKYPFKTIPAALAAVAVNTKSIVLVAAGTYTAAINLVSYVDIVGEGEPGGTPAVTIRHATANAVSVAAGLTQCTLDNLAIAGVGANAYGISMVGGAGAALSLRDCVVTSTYLDGVITSGAATIDARDSSFVAAAGNGVSLAGTSALTAYGCTLTGASGNKDAVVGSGCTLSFDASCIFSQGTTGAGTVTPLCGITNISGLAAALAGVVAANAVTSDMIAANAITEPKIAHGAVTADSLGANAVTDAAIAANSIAPAKLVGGWTGTFLDNAGATVTVTAGIITGKA